MKKFLEFFKDNPWIGASAILFTLISLPFSIFTYIDSHKITQLAYHQHKAISPIFNSKASSNLFVMKDNKIITNDIYSMLISIWNNGDNPISKSSILHPLTIKIKSENDIIDARVIKASCDTVDAKILNQNDKEFSVDWSILEKDDSMLLQIIYQGKIDPDLKIESAIIGQKHITKIEIPNEFQSNDNGKSKSKINILLQFTALLISTFAVTLSMQSIYVVSKKKLDKLFVFIPAVLATIVAIYYIYNIIKTTTIPYL